MERIPEVFNGMAEDMGPLTVKADINNLEQVWGIVNRTAGEGI